MKSEMIYFVCKGEENKIIKITKQRKRAEDCMTELDIRVLWYNTYYYPKILNFKVGDCVNEFKVVMNML